MFKYRKKIHYVMKRVMLFSVLLVVFLAACEQNDEVSNVDSVFEGGSQGVVAEFEPFGVEESGVFTIFDTENFPIEIVLRNLGEEDILPGNVNITLKGINTNDFTGIVSRELTNDETIEKISEFNPQGDEEIIDFTPVEDARYKLNVTGFFQPDIFALVDFNYKTHVVIPNVCYKEDPTDESICDVQGNKAVFVSSAPVTVTSVTEDIAGRGIIVLSIIVSNVGGGRVTLPDTDFDTRFDQIAFTMETDSADWECRSGGRENQARLVNGQATITCRLREPLEEETLFTKQVELTLKYKYQDIIQQTIRIRESLE